MAVARTSTAADTFRTSRGTRTKVPVIDLPPLSGIKFVRRGMRFTSRSVPPLLVHPGDWGGCRARTSLQHCDRDPRRRIARAPAPSKTGVAVYHVAACTGGDFPY